MHDQKYKDVVKFVRDNLRVVFSLDGLGGLIRTRRGLQHFASLKLSDPESQSIYENILKHSFAAEASCPEAGLVFLDKVTSTNHQGLNGVVLSSKKDVVDVLKSKKYKKSIESMLIALLELADADTKITLKKTVSSTPHIEVSDGYTFEVKPLLRETSFEVKNSKVFCVDGFVESVSEIHHLLESLSFHKYPCFLFVRGMSEDVLHTIKVNNERKTLSLFPFVVPYDVENVNTLVDIAVAANTDVTSSLKGQLITSIAIERSGNFDNAVVSKGTIRARCESSRYRVSQHVEALRIAHAEKSELVSSVYEKRIKSMTSNCIDVCIPDDFSFFSDSQQLDEGIRIISSIACKKYDLSKVANAYYESYSAASKDAVRLFTVEE